MVSNNYNEVDQHEALYALASQYPGGLNALADALSRRAGKQMYVAVLRNKLRPGITTHHVTVEELSLIMELCEEAGMPTAFAPLEAMCWRHGRVPVANAVVGDADADPSHAVCKVMSKIGRLADTVAKAAEDNVIDERELEGIEAEFLRASQALAAWRVQIRAQAARQPKAA